MITFLQEPATAESVELCLYSSGEKERSRNLEFGSFFLHMSQSDDFQKNTISKQGTASLKKKEK